MEQGKGNEFFENVLVSIGIGKREWHSGCAQWVEIQKDDACMVT